MPPKGWKKPAPICGKCWPDGWPERAESAACEHGTYVRAAKPEAEGEA